MKNKISHVMLTQVIVLLLVAWDESVLLFSKCSKWWGEVNGQSYVTVQWSLWKVLTLAVYITHIYITHMKKNIVYEWQKKMKQISLDSPAFSHLDIYELHVLFWIHDTSFINVFGLMKHEKITFLYNWLSSSCGLNQLYSTNFWPFFRENQVKIGWFKKK